MSVSDVSRRQILTSKIGPRAERVRGPPFNFQGGGGGGWIIFEINNFKQTLHEIKKILQ